MLWICGRYLDHNEATGRVTWDLVGVFDSENKALQHATAWDYFVAPIPINKLNSGTTTRGWPGAYYPITGELD